MEDAMRGQMLDGDVELAEALERTAFVDEFGRPIVKIQSNSDKSRKKRRKQAKASRKANRGR